MVQATELSPDLVKSSEVVDVSVKNRTGESLGEIQELVLDKITGQVRYVVLSFGGFLGMGDKFFALPWNALKYDENQDAFIIGLDKETLKRAPGFDKNSWPNMSDRRWATEVFKFYGTKPYWE